MVVCVRVCVGERGRRCICTQFSQKLNSLTAVLQGNRWQMFYFGRGGGGVDGRVSESSPSSVISLALCEESAMSKNQGPFCNSERQSIVFEMPYVSETQLSVCFERL